MLAEKIQPRPTLAQQADEMLERRRAFLTEWARAYGFELPPSAGEWDELQAYEQRNAADIERADLMSEVDEILGSDV